MSQNTDYRDEAFDHAVSALGKAEGFLLVTYRMEAGTLIYSIGASSMADQALLTKVADTYLSGEMLALLSGSGHSDREYDEGQEEEE